MKWYWWLLIVVAVAALIFWAVLEMNDSQKTVASNNGPKTGGPMPKAPDGGDSALQT